MEGEAAAERTSWVHRITTWAQTRRGKQRQNKLQWVHRGLLGHQRAGNKAENIHNESIKSPLKIIVNDR